MISHRSIGGICLAVVLAVGCAEEPNTDDGGGGSGSDGTGGGDASGGSASGGSASGGGAGSDSCEDTDYRAGAACFDAACASTDCGDNDSVYDENMCFRPECDDSGSCPSGMTCREVEHASVSCSGVTEEFPECECGRQTSYTTLSFCFPDP